MSDGTPSRLNSASILDAVLLFRTCLVWQVLALLARRPSHVVAHQFYERAMAHGVRYLVQNGLVNAYRVTPKALSHKVTNNRTLYAATSFGRQFAEVITNQRGQLIRRMPEAQEVEERNLLRVALGGYAQASAARRVLNKMVTDGLLTRRELIPDGHMVVLEPTREAWAEYGKHRPEDAYLGICSPMRVPRGLSLHHHLLAVDAALGIQRESGAQLSNFTGDEGLKSEARRGVDMRRMRGDSFDRHPDALVELLAADGTTHVESVEVLSTQYTDATMVEKSLLPEGTRYYTATELVAERFTRLTGERATHLNADLEPTQWIALPGTAHPLADVARACELTKGGRLKSFAA